MQLIKAVLLLAVARLTTAKPPPAGCFEVTEFSAAAVPHSLSVSYSFNQATRFSSNATSCSGYAYTNPNIGPVPLTNCTAHRSKWYFNTTQTGYLLTLQRYVLRDGKRYFLTGSKSWPGNVTKVRHSPPEDPFPYEYMDVAPAFDVPYTVTLLK